MRSMTGYGFAEVQDEFCILSTEVKSYNNRFLEINHNIPSSFSFLEQEIDERIKAAALRGHIEVSLRYKVLKSDVNVEVDEEALKQYTQAVSKIEQATGRSCVFSFADLTEAGNLVTVVQNLDREALGAKVLSVLDSALVQFKESKEREGKNTQADLIRQLEGFIAGFEVVKANAELLEQTIKNQLLERFNEMLGDKGYDEGRFLQEVAVLLNKYTISEEIARLTSHIAEAKRLLNSDEPCGKRMDFLTQEMNRETNTIGSKNIMVGISRAVVDMKDCLENIREQIRNIE